MNKIHCDDCDNDLTNSGNAMSWRIVVDSQHVLSFPGMPVTHMYMAPQIQGPLHFCGLDCLRRWVDIELKGKKTSDT